MRRRHLFVNRIVHIGKEANELEETEVFGVTENSYVKYGVQTCAQNIVSARHESQVIYSAC